MLRFQMGSKEAYRPFTAEGIVKKHDLDFLSFIIPTDSQVQVLKGEGDALSLLDSSTKLPKGYQYVRVISKKGYIPEFGVNLKDIKQPERPKAVLPQLQIPKLSYAKHEEHAQEQDVEGPKKPNPAFFQKEYKQPQGNHKYHQKDEQSQKEQPRFNASFRKEIFEQRVQEDHLGLFKALNLNVSELVNLPEEEIKPKINASYRQAAFRAHPDHGGSHEAMKLVNRAMEIISIPSSRQAYINQTGEFAPREF